MGVIYIEKQNGKIALDPHHKVIEVMGNAAGEGPDGFHFHHMLEPLYDFHPRGDIFQNRNGGLGFVFSNRHYDIQIRKNLSILLIIISFVSASVSNKILIPKLLFKGKRGLFIYSIVFLVIVSLWLIMMALFLITFYNIVAFPNAILPSRADLIILLTGTYFFSLLSSVFYLLLRHLPGFFK